MPARQAVRKLSVLCLPASLLMWKIGHGPGHWLIGAVVLSMNAPAGAQAGA